MPTTIKEAIGKLERFNPAVRVGHVSRVVGLTVEAVGCRASVGEICHIDAGRGSKPVPAEVVGFNDERLLLMPYRSMSGIRPGCLVRPLRRPLSIPVGEALIGRVLDGLGNPIDDRPSPWIRKRRSVTGPPPSPLERKRISEQLVTGVRAVDAVVACGEGQRMGIFSGSGVGKSVLLGMLAKQAEADVVVVALIGERGREVREFLEDDLGSEGLARSVVVAVTGDATALERVKGTEAAMSIAEHFRDEGKKVLLLMDSVTRYAMSLREIGLAAGEPPTSKGYTPSVFAALPRLLERAGNSSKGSITGLFTVLVEGDDLNDPIADAVRSILDGHIVLSRRLAVAGHYPAIDVLESVSRLFDRVCGEDIRRQASAMKAAMALYRENEDIIQLGAYSQGSNDELDRAIALKPDWEAFLRQDVGVHSDFAETQRALATLMGG